jgi:hypothetical protein
MRNTKSLNGSQLPVDSTVSIFAKYSYKNMLIGNLKKGRRQWGVVGADVLLYKRRLASVDVPRHFF